VEIVDINFDNILGRLFSFKQDAIGITSISIDYKKAVDLAKTIKAVTPETPVIIGGVHISTLPSSESPYFDKKWIGEFEDIKELDEIPLPDWSLVNPRYFRYDALTTWGEFGREGAILTSRGCPYKCIFCSTTRFWGKPRYHSPAYVVDMVEDLNKNYGVTHIQIWDDLFTTDKKRLSTIAELLNKNGLTKKVKFNCQPRVNLVDDELCEILKSMNVKIVLFGFESGNDRVLRFLKGGTLSVEDNKRAIETCLRHKLKVQGSVIFGSPTETLDEMRDTIDFIDYAYKVGVNRLWSFVMTPFPDTLVWDIAKARGRVSDDMDWNLLSHQSLDNPLCLDENIDREDFKNIFLEGRDRLNRFKWNKAFSFFKDNPIATARKFISSPSKYIGLLTERKE